jgi:hypothetical protein
VDKEWRRGREMDESDKSGEMEREREERRSGMIKIDVVKDLVIHLHKSPDLNLLCIST